MSGVEFTQQTPIHVLYEQHHTWLRDWLRKRLNCSETAADLAQDTFVRILLKESSAAPNSPRAYLSTIAKGLMFNFWRRQALEKAYKELLLSLPEPVTPSLEEQQLVVESLLQLSAVLDGLSQRDKEIFLLARLDGMKYQQIGERLGISLNVVQKAMVRAMHRCYRVINENE